MGLNVFVRNFNICIVEKERGDVFSTKGKVVLDLKSCTSLFAANAPSILADPFLFIHNGELYLFYEHQDKWVGGKGRICMRKTKDLQVWSQEFNVLEEPFHLSFPNIFEEDGKIYMLPETGGGNFVGLYEPISEDLTKWKRCSVLIDDSSKWYDSTICKVGDYYYLFTGHDNEIEQVQHLFVSSRIDGPYKEHPMSPIAIGRDRGRNAGQVFFYNGSYYRPVQVCDNSYGEQVNIMRIDEISPTDYKESLFLRNVIDDNNSLFNDGGHQFHQVEFNDHLVLALDYRVKNYNLIELYRKTIKRFVK